MPLPREHRGCPDPYELYEALQECSVKDVAIAMRVTPSTVYAWIKNPKYKVVEATIARVMRSKLLAEREADLARVLQYARETIALPPSKSQARHKAAELLTSLHNGFRLPEHLEHVGEDPSDHDEQILSIIERATRSAVKRGADDTSAA